VDPLAIPFLCSDRQLGDPLHMWRLNSTSSHQLSLAHPCAVPVPQLTKFVTATNIYVSGVVTFCNCMYYDITVAFII